MARFHFKSDYGDIGFLARRLQDEGHEVSIAIRDKYSQRVGEGLVPRRDTPPRGAIVLFDSVGHGKDGQALRAQGFKVIGGNPFDADLELDRATGTQIMRDVGITVPKTHAFEALPQVEAFLATHKGRFYVKPHGNRSTTLTHSGDAPTLLRWLRWAKTHGLSAPLELQQEVKGAEISTEGWFDGQRFVPPFNGTLETKKAFAGDLGPRVGCAANVVWPWPKGAKLPQETVQKLGTLLRQHHYVGPVDLNCLVTEAGEPVGLEWSARTGFDALQALALLVVGDYGTQLARFAAGTLDRWNIRDAYGLTLRVTTPPYPMEAPEAAKEKQGLPLDPALLRDPVHLMLDDVMAGPGGPVLAGRDGAVCVVGEAGPDYGTLERKVLARAEALDIPSKAYRVDVIPDVHARWAALQEHGYLEAAEPLREVA